jgi:di/tricarboxylate transporter
LFKLAIEMSMTLEMWIAVAILALAILFFITEWLRVDVVALGVVVSLMLTGILTTDEAIAGFSSSAVLLIAALFIVGGAVFQTGLAGMIGQQILTVAGTNETRLIIVVMVAVAIMSGFMSNTGVVAVMLPAILSLAASTKISPSKLLIPLAFGSSLGGASTLIGTPPNIIVSEILAESGEYEAFGFFDYTPLAILLLIAGVIFMLTIGKRLLPDHKPEREDQEVATPNELMETYALPNNIYRVRVRKASDLIGKRIDETDFAQAYDIDIVEISRPAPPRKVASIGTQEIVLQSKKNMPIHPRPDTVLHRDDILILRGEGVAIGRCSAKHYLKVQPSQHAIDETQDSLINHEVGVAEIVIPPRSSLIGRTLLDVRFGTRYQLTVLGIKRADSSERTMDVKHTKLRFGDTLLVQGEWRNIMQLKRLRRDFALLDEISVAANILNRKKAPVVALVLIGMLFAMVFGSNIGIGTTTAAMLGALAVVLTGCLTMDEAYDAIDWKSLVLIAGMLPMSTALVKVGLVDVVAQVFTQSLGTLGPVVVLAGLYLLTATFTQVLSNTATAVLIAPIALAIAETLGVTPYAFMMAVAVAASMAFASPVASPVNTLVMGAGHYRFGDYLKIGLPLMLVMLVVSVIVLPILFPF